MKIFTGSAHPALAKEICTNLSIDLGKSETIRFSNENIMVKIHENVRGEDVYVIQPSVSPVSEGIIELLMMLDALKHSSAQRITAVIPYFPYARSDKKDQPRISITARLMADLIETAGADRVLTMDLHAPQIQGFFRIPVDQLRAINIICDHLKNGDISNYVLVASDAGEAKDAGRFANRLHLPMAIIDKRRHGNDERPIPTNLIGDVKGKKVFLVDDEISTAGTIISGLKFLFDHGATDAVAACTHPILCGPAIQRIAESKLSEVVVTNTIPIAPEKMIDKITVLSVAPVFSKAIKCVHEGESISSLFD
ncbi:MAG: ribose-phosphate pyrophosphokinase [Pseudomonadota bacterium]